MTLHLVFSRKGYESCVARRHPKDPIILFGDGAYALLENDIKCLVLGEDAIARGIAVDAHHATSIDYAEVVKLTLNHAPVVSWAD